MIKILRCRDVGMDCDFVARGGSEEEILEQAAHHAREAHGMAEISAELLAKVKAAIQDE